MCPQPNLDVKFNGLLECVYVRDKVSPSWHSVVTAGILTLKSFFNRLPIRPVVFVIIAAFLQRTRVWRYIFCLFDQSIISQGPLKDRRMKSRARAHPRTCVGKATKRRRDLMTPAGVPNSLQRAAE